jgi:hypothetical protein
MRMALPEIRPRSFFAAILPEWGKRWTQTRPPNMMTADTPERPRDENSKHD